MAVAKFMNSANPSLLLAADRLANWQRSEKTTSLETSFKRALQSTTASLSVESQLEGGVTLAKVQHLYSAFSSLKALEENPNEPTYVTTSNTLTKRGNGTSRTFSVTRKSSDGTTTELREFKISKPGSPHTLTFRTDQDGGKVLKVATQDAYGGDTARFAINIKPDGTLHSVVATVPIDSALQQDLPSILREALTQKSLAPYRGLIQTQLDLIDTK